MTSELRPAVDVWEDAYRAWDDAPINPDRIGKVNGEGYSFVDEDRAAAAVIEADREAVRAEQAAELAKYKALAETLAGALGEIAQPDYGYMDILERGCPPEKHIDYFCSMVTWRQRTAREALREYKEAHDV